MHKFWNTFLITLRADSVTTYICPEISTTSNTHAARENLPRLVALRNLFIIVFFHSTALPFFGKISEGNQARYIYSRVLHGNFWPTLDNYYTLMNCNTEFFNKNLSTNFGLIAVFVKVALEITKRAQHYIAFDSDSHVFMFFRNHASLLAFSWL